MIDLRTCQVGQLLKDGRGHALEYKRTVHDEDCNHVLWDELDQSEETFTDEGVYDIDHPESYLNIVEILPWDQRKSLKPYKHPSLAAWESFPWITDRVPTRADMTQQGWLATRVLTFNSGSFVGLHFFHCNEIELGTKWIHLPNWTPPKLTPQEEALALLKGKDDDWVPSAEEWFVLRKAINP